MAEDEKVMDTLVEQMVKGALTKTYKIRTTGEKGATLETTIPREVIEREAREMDLPFDEAVKKLRGKWHYNNFDGLYFTIERADE